MEMLKDIETSNWWWLDSHNNRPKGSPWLHSTLSDLDRKTKAMLKLIEEDADSFAKRAEMYYRRRPELISMVEDIYRAYRSLAERYDNLKSDSGTRLSTTYGSPFSSFKCRSEKSSAMSDHTSDICSESFDPEEYAESEVEDPEQDQKTQAKTEAKEVVNPIKGNNDSEVEEGGDSEDEDGTLLDEGAEEHFDQVFNNEVMKLKDEAERLKEENKVQKAQLMEISELCNVEVTKLRLQVERLKEENKVQKAQLMEKNKENSKLLSELCSGEAMKLRVEVERLLEENKIQKAQLMEEKENSKISIQHCNDEVMKLRGEVEKMTEENQSQKAQLIQGEILSELCNDEVTKLRLEMERLMKEEEKKSELLIVCNNEVPKLREQVERLKEKEQKHEAELMQKDEEKREVIRQLTLAIQVHRDQSTELRKSITKDPPKKWSPFEFNKLNGGFFGKFSTGPQKFQATVVAL